jgi:hypothetical protein
LVLRLIVAVRMKTPLRLLKTRPFNREMTPSLPRESRFRTDLCPYGDRNPRASAAGLCFVAGFATAGIRA